MNNNQNKPELIYFVYKLGFYSGAAKQALSLARALTDKYNITIINVTCGTPAVTNEYNIKIINFDRGLKSMIKLWAFLVTTKATFVHFHGFFVLPKILCSFLNFKMFLKSTLVGDDDFDSVIKRKPKFLYRYLIQKIHFNNALSEQIYNINKKYTQNIGRIINGVNLLDSAKEKAEQFLFIGAIVERKRPDLSITFFLDMLKKGIISPSSILKLIGPYEGNDFDGSTSYYSYCLSLIPNEYRDNVIFLGNQKQSYVFEQLALSKGLLFFSDKEGIANVLLEAMSSNCVPIVNCTSGCGIIENGVNGIVVACYKSLDLVLKPLNSIIENECAKTWVSENATFDIVAKQHDEIYKKLM